MNDDDDINKNARATDPDTSHEAGSDVHELAADRRKVFATFKGSSQPLADFQLEELLGGAMNGKWRKRRSDLSRDEVLREVDRTINPATTKQVIRWGINTGPKSTTAKPKPKPKPSPKPSMEQEPSLLTLMGKGDDDD